MTIRASICIPTLSARRLPYLREAVASALAQTCREIEVIVSDDGNDAPVRDFAEQAAAGDSRVRYRRNPQRLGLGGNWNAVAADARGEYLVIIGDDDRLLPDFVRCLLSRAQGDFAVIFSNHHVIDSSGARLEGMTRDFTTSYGRDTLPPGELSDPAARVWRNSIPMSSSLIRTADVKRLGIKPDLNTPEIELFARLAAERKRFFFVPEFLGEYRVHPMSETSAGLASERLIKYLEHIPVERHVEPLKQRWMNALLVRAVTKALSGGDIDQARALTRHPYYPTVSAHPSRVVPQRVLSALPAPLARPVVTFLSRARRELRRRRGA